MNDKRRKTLARAEELLKTALKIVTDALEKEQDSRDNIPESLEDSNMAVRMDEAIDALDDAVAQIEEALDSICKASA